MFAGRPFCLRKTAGKKSFSFAGTSLLTLGATQTVGKTSRLCPASATICKDVAVRTTAFALAFAGDDTACARIPPLQSGAAQRSFKRKQQKGFFAYVPLSVSASASRPNTTDGNNACKQQRLQAATFANNSRRLKRHYLQNIYNILLIRQAITMTDRIFL